MSKRRVELRTDELRHRIEHGQATDKDGKPISSVRLLNKMGILNSAADKLKKIEQ